jgi:hypothetical protein
MCMFKTPKMPDAPPERQAARAPDRSGPSSMAAGDIQRRRLAMASSIFTSPTLGAPATTRPLGA